MVFKRLLVSSMGLSLFTIMSYANSNSDIKQINETQYNQFKQRIEQIEDHNMSSTVHIEPTHQQDINRIITGETPCFPITDIQINTAEDGQRVFKKSVSHLKQGKYNIIGQCIGEQGLNQITRSVQNELLKAGFITSQAVIEPQELATGKLMVTVIPGRMNAIWISEDTTDKVNTSNSIAMRQGDILNLREVETSLENLRLPQSVLANIQIIPSIEDTNNQYYGSSDLLINYKKDSPLHFELSIDDAGSSATGEYQATLTTTIDNPLNANDVLDVSYTHTIDPWNDTETDADNRSIYASYTYPFKKWQLRLSHSDYGFHQTLAGLNNDIVYSGETSRTRADLQRVLHRNGISKTLLSLGGYHKRSKNLFDDEEIEVQRRQTSGWSAGIQHERETKLGSVSLGLQYERGTGAFAAIPAPESYVSDVESRPGIWSANASLVHPFTIGDGFYQYRTNLRGQYSRYNLIPQDRFGIGGRYSVRGFDDEQSLSGENGLIVQQEIGRIIPVLDMTLMPYATLDQGFVSGESTEYLAGIHLVGTSLGLRLYSPNMSLDTFVGRGLKAPRQMDKDSTAGFRFSIFY